MQRFILEVLEKSGIMLLVPVLQTGAIAGFATPDALGAIVAPMRATVIALMTFCTLLVLLGMNESPSAIGQQVGGGCRL
jgi:hypothetical protein